MLEADTASIFQSRSIMTRCFDASLGHAKKNWPTDVSIFNCMKCFETLNTIASD